MRLSCKVSTYGSVYLCVSLSINLFLKLEGTLYFLCVMTNAILIDVNLIGVPTMVSVIFFKEVQRGRSTAVMYVATYIGKHYVRSFIVQYVPRIFARNYAWSSSLSRNTIPVLFFNPLTCFLGVFFFFLFLAGVCSSYIFYNMIEHTASFKGFQWLLYSEAAAAFLLLIATVYTFPGGVHFRGVVPLQDSLSGSDYKDGSKEEAESLNGEKGGRTVWRNSTDVALAPSRLGFGEGLLHCLRQPSVVLIVVAAAAVNGTLNSWQGVIPILFKDLGNATGNANATDGGNGFKSSRGDICSLVSSLGYAVGGYFGGELGDRCFANKLKLLLVICISLGAATFLFIVLLIPPGFMCNPCIPINNSGPDAVYALLLGFSFTSGACLGGTMPISLELLAATAYPAAEGITANASLFLTQLFCFALTALVLIWSAQVVTFAVLATAVACLLLTLIARPSNNRRKAQLKAAAHDTYLN